MKKFIIIFITLFSISAHSSTFDFFFWNLDAEEAGIGGAVTAVKNFDFGPNLNPAAIPVLDFKKPKLIQRLSFINAFRQISILLRELGAIPYDLIDSDEKWDDTKHHSKWLVLSLLSIYRFHHCSKYFTLSFTPLKEIPSPKEITITSSSLAFTVNIFKSLNLGIETSYYYLVDDEHIKPFSIVKNNVQTKDGFGASAGLFFSLKKFSFGIDYRFRPKKIFSGLETQPYPVKDNCFSLGVSYTPLPNLATSFDLINFNNTNRDDFLSPRAGIQWFFIRNSKNIIHNAKLLFGTFADENKKAFLTTGITLDGLITDFLFKSTLTFIFDINSGKRNALVFSFDFYN